MKNKNTKTQKILKRVVACMAIIGIMTSMMCVNVFASPVEENFNSQKSIWDRDKLGGSAGTYIEQSYVQDETDITDYALKLRIKTATGANPKYFHGTRTYHGGTFSVKYTPLNITGDNYASLYFRALSHNNNLYRVNMYADKIVLQSRTNYKNATLGSATYSSLGLGDALSADTEYSIKISFETVDTVNYFKVWVNDILAVDYKGATTAVEDSNYYTGNENTTPRCYLGVGLHGVIDDETTIDVDEATAALFDDFAGDLSVYEFVDYWYDEYVPVTDYAYSFAVVGDIQNLTEYYPAELTHIYDWIYENAEDKKTKFVFNLGDITNSDTTAEWALAKAVIQKLDKGIPYSVIRGNHDSKEQYNTFFPYSEYEDRISGSYDGTMLNTYQKFAVGKIKYLVVNLDFGATDGALAWASEIIEAHPDYNVIVTTHSYLLANGELATSHTFGEANSGAEIWDELIKNHENIVMVLCGHVGYNNIKVAKREGVNGNIVTEILVDPQGLDVKLGACGMVAMLYFSEDGKNVDVEYYSTVRDSYFLEENQFAMDVNVIESNASEDATGEINLSDFSFNVGLEGDTATGDVYIALYDANNMLMDVVKYDTQETIAASFERVKNGGHIKVMWWNDNLDPVCTVRKITVE